MANSIILCSDDYVSPIRIEHIGEPLKVLPYGDKIRVMYEALAYTGCRIAELKKFSWNNILKINGKYFIYFKLGKNQKEHRQVELPYTYIKELEYYKATNLTKGLQIFSITEETFRSEFNKFVRPKLSKPWHEMFVMKDGGKMQLRYRYNFRSLRKTFQTLKFVKYWDKYHDANASIQFTAAEMKYGSERISSHHYIRNIDDFMPFKQLKPTELFANNKQKNLMEF